MLTGIVWHCNFVIVIYYVQGEDSLSFWKLCPILLASLVNKICSTHRNANSQNKGPHPLKGER